MRVEAHKHATHAHAARINTQGKQSQGQLVRSRSGCRVSMYMLVCASHCRVMNATASEQRALPHIALTRDLL